MIPLVSAIILTHNRKSLVTRAIDSALNQSYPYMECIVVDDASSDGTREMLSAREDIQYIYIPQEESRGGNYARNVGIKAAKGKYVAMLDDDDFWLPTKIEKQVKLIEEKECDLVYCGSIPEIVNPDGSIEFGKWSAHPDGQGDLSKLIFTRIWVLNCAMMIRKSALDMYGFYDENLRYWQEFELNVRLAQYSPFYFVNEVLMVFRVDKTEKQRLTNHYYGWRKSLYYIYHKHKKIIKKLPLSYKIDFVLLCLNEAAMRCKAANMMILYYFYRNLKRIINGLRKFWRYFSKKSAVNQ